MASIGKLVYGVGVIVDRTNELVTKIAGTQQRYGTRLEEIQQALDLTVGRMDRIDGRMERIEDTQRRQVDTQRQQYETLNAKLDDIVGLLRGNQPTD